MYRSGGENVYPAEIEKVLSNHPKILQVAIIGVPDDRWGETGMAFVVPAEGHTLTYEEMITFLKGKIASYKFPKYLKIMDKIPMTESGKMKKVLLKNMVSSGSRGFECLKAEAG
jgi:fatty-acyl-CoA synthase